MMRQMQLSNNARKLSLENSEANIEDEIPRAEPSVEQEVNISEMIEISDGKDMTEQSLINEEDIQVKPCILKIQGKFYYSFI